MAEFVTRTSSPFLTFRTVLEIGLVRDGRAELSGAQHPQPHSDTLSRAEHDESLRIFTLYEACALRRCRGASDGG